MLVKNVEVDGFNYGIKCYASQNSQTFEHITLKNQKICGIYNQSQVISIRDLKSTNTVTAVNNVNSNGVITIIGAQLNGGAPSNTAIINNSIMYLRNIEADGYGKLVFNKAGNSIDIYGTSIDEWTSHRKVSLFDGNPSSMLNLEIKETPELTVDPLDQWIKVPASSGGDDTKKIQDAIDSGKTTVYFPRGNYNLNGIVYVRGNVKRIIGLEANININSSSGFVVDEGTAPTVVFERFISGYGTGYIVTQASSRTVVVRNSCNIAVKKNAGTGDLYLEDVCNNPSPFEFHGGNVWARQFNVENAGTHVINDGANLWILGMKTERDGVLIETKNGGKTELLGFFCYTTITPADTMFVNNESSFSAIGSETCWANKGYNYFLKETRGGVTKALKASQLPFGNGNGHALPFLVSGGTITVPATQITIVPKTIELMPFQDTALMVTFTPVNTSNKTINWSSTNDTIALIDLYGKITALNYGTAFIIAETEDASLRDSCQITVTDTPNNLMKPDIKSAFTFFPNPVSDILTITFNENWSSYVIIRIYNALGQQVFSMKKNSPQTESAVLIDVKSLQYGLYCLRAEDGERIASKSLIVER